LALLSGASNVYRAARETGERAGPLIGPGAAVLE
jgi:hypothetical protein